MNKINAHKQGPHKPFKMSKQMPESSSVQIDISRVLSQIFGQLFGMRQTPSGNLEQISVEDVQTIFDQIRRLKSIAGDFFQLNRRLEISSKSSNEEKWKIIVITYRQKLARYQSIMRQDKVSKKLLEAELEEQRQQIQRLNYMNGIKFQKIRTLIGDIEERDCQAELLSNSLLEMEGRLVDLQLDNTQTHERFVESQCQKENLKKSIQKMKVQLNDLSKQLVQQREKSVFFQQSFIPQARILEEVAYQNSREIEDLKLKYELEIAHLQMKERALMIQKEEQQLQLLELRQRTSPYQIHQNREAQSQTDDTVVRACFYTSLADDISQQDDKEYQEKQVNVLNSSIDLDEDGGLQNFFHHTKNHEVNFDEEPFDYLMDEFSQKKRIKQKWDYECAKNHMLDIKSNTNRKQV